MAVWCMQGLGGQWMVAILVPDAAVAFFPAIGPTGSDNGHTALEVGVGIGGAGVCISKAFF